MSFYLGKYTLTSADCHRVAGVSKGYGFLMISSTEYILWGLESTYHNYIFKVTYGSSTATWADSMTWTVGTCVMSSAEFILSSDSLTIYSFFLYQDGKPFICFQ